MSKVKREKRRSRRKFSELPSPLRGFLCFLFSFLLSLVLTVIGFLFAGRIAFSEQYVKSRFDDTYYEYVLESIEEDAADYTLPTGIDGSVLEGVFSTEQIRQDVTDTVTGAFGSRDHTPDVSELEKKLADNTHAFFEANDVSVSGDTEEAISEYVSEISGIYRTGVKLPGIDHLTSVGKTYNRFFIPGLLLAVVFAMILLRFCIRLRSMLHRGLRYVAYALGGAAAMTFAAPFTVFVTGLYTRLNITPQYYNYLVTGYLRGILVFCMLIAGVWLLLTVIMAIVIGVLRKRLMRR